MRSTFGGGGLPRVLAGGLALFLVAGGSSRADDKDAQAKKEKAAKVVEEKKAAVKKAAEKAADAVGEAVGNLVEGFFLGGQAEAVEAAAAIQVMDVAVGNGDPFDQQVRPILTSVLNSELHFIRKVCKPTPEQFAKIRAAGREQFEKDRKKFVELIKNQNRGNVEFPDPRTEISNSLAEAVLQHQSPEAAARYRTELEHRKTARQQAAIDNMVMRLDRTLALSPEQSQKLTETMTAQASPKWTKQMVAFLYSEEYAPLPEGKIVLPVLNADQKKIWQAMPQGYSVSFGWQGEFNFLGDQFDAFAEEVGK